MKYRGRIAFEGYAIANVVVYSDDNSKKERTFTKIEDEFNRFKAARASAVKSFDELYEDALKNVGEGEAILFQTYKLMAEDLDLEDLVRACINEEMVAEEAVKKASSQLAETFAALDDDYMKQRATDVLEVGKTIVDVLLGRDRLVDLKSPSILVCNDMAASMLMRFDRTMLKGLVLIKGNENSHVAIFARTLEIPTLVSVKDDFTLTHALNNKIAIIDSIKGNLIINPSNKELEYYKDVKDSYEKELLELKKFINKPSVSKDGVGVKIYANIASTFEIESVKKHDAEGIGLFRSEFIYLASKNYPTEDFQFNYYREVVEEMKGKEVIIRTLDIGADKKVDYFKLDSEENPALGLRSIRLCRKRPDIFITQLRALYRASIYGKLAIMIPMIVSVEEINFVKDCIQTVKEDLTNNNIPFDDKVRVGIMIETPAAAIISDELAKHVDFFSIGTNDLSQYTLACDRLNPALSDTFNSKHHAIMRLIKLTVDNAHKNGIVCGMCGELGRDPDVLPFLAAIHLDEISCSAAYVLKTRKLLSEVDTSKVNIDSFLLK